jgi:hypothetical protein
MSNPALFEVLHACATYHAITTLSTHVAPQHQHTFKQTPSGPGSPRLVVITTQQASNSRRSATLSITRACFDLLSYWPVSQPEREGELEDGQRQQQVVGHAHVSACTTQEKAAAAATVSNANWPIMRSSRSGT